LTSRATLEPQRTSQLLFARCAFNPSNFVIVKNEEMATSKGATHQQLCVLMRQNSSTRAEVIRLHLSTRQKSKYLCVFTDFSKIKSEPRKPRFISSAKNKKETLLFAVIKKANTATQKYN
jgi:hypothetical protein